MGQSHLEVKHDVGRFASNRVIFNGSLGLRHGSPIQLNR